jgi:bifunctional non-homologous end joining protein LigD
MIKPDLRPMLATLTDRPFDDSDWVFETKWDGFRALAVAAPKHVALYSRNGNNISEKYPTISAALVNTRHEAVIDGELVALDHHGRSRFQLLQNVGRNSAQLLYCVFDLLYLDGKDLRGKPLLERKAELAKTLPKNALLRYSAHVVGEGIKAFKSAARAQEEGIIAKLAGGRYYSGERTREWLKIKTSHEQEVVIIGFTAPRGSRQYFGALLFAVCDRKGWKYVGRAGTGFDTETLRSVHEKLIPLTTDKKPIAEKVPDLGRTTWVTPKLVAEVKFSEWTAAGEMRHPVFLGLRNDKAASEVIKETPKPLGKVIGR